MLTRITIFIRNRDVAEDITATAFVVAYEYFHSFRGESSFYTWLYAIALNEARRHWSRNRTLQLVSIDSPNARELAEPDLIFQTLERRECCVMVWKVLHQIPTVYRRTLVNHFVYGYSVKRIARHDRVPVGTALSRIFTGKKILRQKWGGLNGRN